MRFIGFTLLAMFSSSVFAQSNTILTCYGVSTHQIPVIAVYAVNNVGGSLTITTKDKTLQSPLVAHLRYEFRVLQAPVAIVTSLNGDEFRAVPQDGGGARLTVSLKNQNFNETIERAKCESSNTDWRSVATLPSSAIELWKIVDRSFGKKQAFDHVINMVANTGDTLESLPEFFRIAMKFIDDQKFCAEKSTCEFADLTVYAAFASKMTAKDKVNFLDQLTQTHRANDSEILAGLRDNHGSQSDDDFLTVLDAESAHLRGQLASNGFTAELRPAFVALAEIVLSRNFEESPKRAAYIDALFSTDVLAAKGEENLLGSYGEILTQNLETAFAAKDAHALFDRILKSNIFTSGDAQPILNSLLRRHAAADLSNAETQSDLKALVATGKLNGTLLVQATREVHWIDADDRVQQASTSTDRSNEYMKLALTEAKEPFVLEAVLAKISAEAKEIPSESLIVRTIAGQLTSSDTRFLSFQIEGHKRGLASDLIKYAFTRKSARPDDSFNLVMKVLDDSRVSAAVLTDVLVNLGEDCPNWRRDQTSEILRAVVHHSQFFETSTRSAPEQMADLLAKSVGFPKEPLTTNIDTFVIRDLLKESMESPLFPKNLRSSIPAIFDSLKEL